jgi:hypothetical protein
LSVECGSDVILLRGSVRPFRARIAEYGPLGEMVQRRQIADSGALLPLLGRTQIAGSACGIHLLAASSVRPRMSDLGVDVRSLLRAGLVTARDPSADSRDGFTAVFGCRTHVCHHRLQCREPQVIGAPPAHLVELPGIDPGPDHRRRPQRILGLVVLGLRVGLQCRDAIAMASVMVDEICLRARARPLDEPGE